MPVAWAPWRCAVRGASVPEHSRALLTLQYVSGPAFKAVKNISLFNTLKSYGPTLAVWGGVVGVGALTFTERVPLIRETFLVKIPVVGSHWEYNPDPEDVPV